MNATGHKVVLGDVLKLANDVVDIDATATYPIAGVYSFGRGLLRRAPISGTETTYKKFHRLKHGDFIISQLKAWEGALCLIPPEFDGSYVSPQFQTFTGKDNLLDLRYLNWFSKQKNVWEALRRKSRGMGARRDSVSPKAFLSLEIPLPPLSAQRRIVAKLDQLAAKIEEAKEAVAKIEANIAATITSRLDECYRELASQYGTEPLAQLCESITDGDHLTPNFTSEGVQFIFVGNVSRGELHFDGCKYVSQEYFDHLKPSRRPARGDILYTAVGATLGVPAVVNTDSDFCFQRHVAILKLDRESTNVTYLQMMLRSGIVHRAAWSSTTGSAQPTIPLRSIRALEVPVPPLEVQQRVVFILERLVAAVSEAISSRSASGRLLDALLPSILDKAFRGEL